jgi:RimJ/RimL family protein N-acetyltransferase
MRERPLFEIALVLAGALFKRESIVIYRRELEGSVGPANRPGEGDIARGNAGDLETLRQRPGPVPWEFCCDRLDGVTDFFVGRSNGSIGHISWIYYRKDPNRIIDLAPDEAEIKYSLTLPEFRGQGLYPATLGRIREFLRKKGYKRVFICVRADNRSSLRGIEKAGFQRTAKIRLVKIMGVQVSRRYAGGH